MNMTATYSFEYQLFKLISHEFPFLEILRINNSSPQTIRNHSGTAITFPYLVFLNLKQALDDYAEQFLLKKYIHLPRLLNLCIKYQSLTTITNNFSTLKKLDLYESFVRPQNFKEYFPLL